MKKTNGNVMERKCSECGVQITDRMVFKINDLELCKMCILKDQEDPDEHYNWAKNWTKNRKIQMREK